MTAYEKTQMKIVAASMKHPPLHGPIIGGGMISVTIPNDVHRIVDAVAALHAASVDGDVQVTIRGDQVTLAMYID